MKTSKIGNLTLEQVLNVIAIDINRDQIFSVLNIFDKSIVKNSIEGEKVDSLISKVIMLEDIKNGNTITLDTNSYNDGNNIFDEYLTFSFTGNGVVITKFNTSYMQDGVLLEQSGTEWNEAIQLLTDTAVIKEGAYTNNIDVLTALAAQVVKAA